MRAGPDNHPADWRLVGAVKVRCTGWAEGDMAGEGAAVQRRRQAVAPTPWTLLKQVHGARVVVVEGPGGGSGESADAAVAAVSGVSLAVLTADCAPVVLASPEGLFGVAHAGWRGLRAGVIEATVQTMRRLGATQIDAVIGPSVHPCCYSFGADDLADMEAKFGPSVSSRDRRGEPALDLAATVRSALHAGGVRMVGESPDCTCCSEGFWSWRSDQTPRRQATVAWRE